MIRRFAVPAVAVALVLALGACATPSPPAPAAAAPVPADTLGRIKAAKTINVAFAGDSLPFSFVGPDNQPAGYSIDLCKHVIAAIGRAAGEPNLAVHWKVGTTAERLAMVGDGRADLECGNTTPTLSRMKIVDFSNLMFVDASGFLVRGDARIGRAAELGGQADRGDRGHDQRGVARAGAQAALDRRRGGEGARGRARPSRCSNRAAPTRSPATS